MKMPLKLSLWAERLGEPGTISSAELKYGLGQGHINLNHTVHSGQKSGDQDCGVGVKAGV